MTHGWLLHEQKKQRAKMHHFFRGPLSLCERAPRPKGEPLPVKDDDAFNCTRCQKLKRMLEL
jgi:hypothetical protein